MSNISSNPNALRIFASVLAAYQARMYDALTQAENKYRIAEHKIESEIDARARAVRQLQSAYESCIAEQQNQEACNTYWQSNQQDSQPINYEPKLDCNKLESALQEAHSRLNTALNARSRLNTAYSIYRVHSQQFAQALDLLGQHAGPELMRLADQLDIYLVPSAEIVSLGKVDGELPKVEASRNRADCEMTMITHLSTNAPPGFPESYTMLPLSIIPTEQIDEIKQRGFTKGYTEKDMEWAFNALHSVVLPALARGKNLDHFQLRDQQYGLYGTRSYTSTYLGFFRDSNAIAAELKGTTWNLLNGRHRAYVAHKLGLTEIPVRLIGTS